MESLHPMVVHFPIALLLSAVALDLIAFAGKWPQIHRVALWNFCLGTVGAAVAVLTGLQAEKIAKHSFDIWKVMERHEQLGVASLILGALVVSFRLLKRDALGAKARVLILVVSGILIGTLCYGAHLGGRLVYEFGVGGSFGK